MALLLLAPYQIISFCNFANYIILQSLFSRGGGKKVWPAATYIWQFKNWPYHIKNTWHVVIRNNQHNNICDEKEMYRQKSVQQ